MEDLLTALLGDGSNLCLSGGAKGADLQWGMCAGMAGHKVIHWSFEKHYTQAPEIEVVRLSPEQLAEGDEPMKRAAKALKKGVPHKPWIKPLIQRNWFQVRWSSSCYAVCDIIDGVPQGGTAWAVQMFLHRKFDGEKNLDCYVFDQKQNAWFHFYDLAGFVMLAEPPPTPAGIWAGVGTRELHQNGKVAIRNLLGYPKQSV
jgi:hypothetical protein